MKRIRIFALVLCLVFVFGLISGCSKDEYADPEGRFLKPKKLSAKLEQQIEEDFAKCFEDPYTILSADNIQNFYFGTHNGAVALLILPVDNDEEGNQSTQYIAEYPYEVNVIGAAIYLYKDGTFTEGNKAYESGMITNQDAEAITWLYNNPSAWH